MKKPVVSLMTLCLLIFFLCFFSFVHSLFRLQMFKHVVSEELVQKLQVETLKMKEDYESIAYEAELSQERILQGSQMRSELVVDQIYGLITSVEEREGSLTKPEQMARLKELLVEYNNGAEQCFWILDEKGAPIIAPPTGITDVKLTAGSISMDWDGNQTDGPLVLQDKERGMGNPGYGKRITGNGWLLAAFQPWGTLKEKLDGVDSIKKMKCDRLISRAGIIGSAGIVDGSMLLKEYSYTQLENHHVDDIHIASRLPASVTLFNKNDGIYEYVISQPPDKRAKFRQTYVEYDEKTGNHYFIGQDIHTIFNGIDRRSSPMLVYQAALTLVMFFMSIAVIVWEMILRRGFREDKE